MFDFVGQLGAFIGTSVILFIVTQPKKENDDDDGNTNNLSFKGARKYSREGRRQTSFGMHDDFDM
jgi:hypothetical protein